jgi:predicted SAM-dependent methyltransferase
LHGVYFTDKREDGDKTKACLRPREWWVNLFHEHAPNYPVELVDKDSLENGVPSADFLNGGGEIKLNLGSASTHFHHGWINLDVIDFGQYAAGNRSRFQRCDVRDGLPFGTSSVDLIMSCHQLEHLDAKAGLAMLRECRRILRAQGFLRVLVPDAKLLTSMYVEGGKLSMFDELNQGCRESKTDAGKLWSLLHQGHECCYDEPTLLAALDEAGFTAKVMKFRQSDCPQLLKESSDALPDLSLIVEARPRMDA